MRQHIRSWGILLTATMLAFAIDAYAAQISFISVSGNWHDAVDSMPGDQSGDPAISNGVPTSSIQWGVGDPQSGYDFTRSIPGDQTLPPAPTPYFPLGTFTHRNFPINEPSLTSVQLDVVLVLSVDGVQTNPLSFTFTFNHVETPNNQNPCPFPTPNGEGCTDRVTFVSSPQPTTFTVDGVEYTLSMSFVDGSGNPVGQFYTRESLVNTANLVGQFTVAPPRVTFTANPTSISAGASSLLTWLTQNASAVAITPDIGSVALNGSQLVSPSATTTYTLTATGSGGVTTATATITVTSPPSARFDFNPTSYLVNEDAGYATITVVRAVSATGTSTVEFAATNGSASANQDYLGVSGTLTFASGETSKTFDIPLIDDALVESPETVNLTLSGPVNATLGTSQAVLTIQDNDTTNPPPPPPAPFVSELVPYSVPVNFNLTFTMRVLGSGFDAASAEVLWNNSVSLPVVSRSTSEIIVSMTPNLWNGTPGQYPVKVRNPGPIDSNEAPFTVRPVTSGNAPPWVVQQPAANPNPVNGGTSTQLSTLGGTHSNNGSESVLIYTWTSNGPAPVTFSSNGTNAAKNATATFSRMGTYTFQARIRDTVTGFAVDTEILTVVVNAAVGSVTVSPRSAVLQPGQDFSFTAAVRDQFGAPFSATVTWTASAGAISANSGSFTAPQQGSNITVTASAGGHSDSAQVTVIVDGAGSSGDLSNVRLGPVPFKANSGDPGVTFRNLPMDSTIKIFTMSGRIVQTIQVPAGGDQLWDIRNANLDKVSSGVYFYRIESGGNKKEGKLVIIQ